MPENVFETSEMKDIEIDFTTKEGFLTIFSELVGILRNDLNFNGFDLPKDAVNYLVKMMEYNIPKGKLTRGLTVVNTFKSLCPKSSAAEVKRAAVLGWCMEWLQAAFLVADDIMDNSITRRGQPCWYKNRSVGMIAINDAFILLIQAEVLLLKFFNKDSEQYRTLHGFLISIIYKTEMGQNLDLSTQPPDKSQVDLSLFTLERYNKIVKYKTAFYSFYAPIALGMICANVFSKESLQEVEKIALKMGRYFQVQDDYLDVYGDPDVLGKIGTDIQDSKCSWLIITALQDATVDQKHVLEMNYGKDDGHCITAVKLMFDELNLQQKYKTFEDKIYAELKQDIETCECPNFPKLVFKSLLKKIYKRSK